MKVCIVVLQEHLEKDGEYNSEHHIDLESQVH